jgi:hypothetical protein
MAIDILCMLTLAVIRHSFLGAFLLASLTAHPLSISGAA